MALETTTYKSVGLILAIALVGVIIIVATISLQNRRPSEDAAAPLIEPESGLVFDSPSSWTVGTANTNTLRLRPLRISQIQTQKTSCLSLSTSLSKSIEESIEKSSVIEQWHAEFPGLVASRRIDSGNGTHGLVGIDTCDPILTRRTMTLRAQFYKSGVELQFARELPQSGALSTTELRDLARDVFEGRGPDDLAQEFSTFTNVLNSIR